MRTDAMESFFNGNGATVKRMDCTGIQHKSRTGMGSATEGAGTDAKIPFKKALAEVTAGNIAAHRITKATMVKKQGGAATASGQGTSPKVSQKPESAEEYTRSENPLMQLAGMMAEGVTAEPADAEGEMVLVSDEIAADAETILKEALADISEALGISIFGNLEDLSLKEVGGDAQAQFSEIVFILKKMVQAFGLGRENGMPVELPNQKVEGGGIDALSDVLRVGTFKIEVACSMLGIAESVQKQVEVKMEVYQAGGIIQATDPSTLAMASQHTERLFKGLFTANQSTPELTALVQQVKKLLAENGGEQPVVVVDKAGVAVPVKGDLQQFDAQVYRAMLKIDLKEQVGLQNGAAALDGEKPAGLKTGQPLLPVAQNPGELKAIENTDAGSVLEVQLGAQQKQAAGMEARLSGTLLRMTDETVMEQVTGKLQSVMRSGMSDVRIQLRPESLGEVSMRIRMEGDVVLAKIEVQNQQVKEIMERNLPMLKDALAQQNISTGTFEIQVGNGSGRHFGNMPHSPWNDEETAQNGLYGQGKEDEHGSSKENRHDRGSETGRRFGSNSVEYFA